jgi:hypothetical protein
VECPNGLYWARAYVNKLILFEREFGTYEAMQIHRFGDIYRSARIVRQEEAQRQRIAQRGVQDWERIVRVWRFGCRHMSSQHVQIML